MNQHVTADPNLVLLHQLFSEATRHASAAMEQWTSGQVAMSLDRVIDIPFEEVASEVETVNDYVTMIVFTLTGEFGGYFILSFDEENGRELAAQLCQSEVCTEPEWTNLEKSALNETGNILSCAYFNAITELLNVELVPSTPSFIQDFGGSVLQQAILPQATERDRVLICDTRFERNKQNIRWSILFVPDANLRNMLDRTLESATEDDR